MEIGQIAATTDPWEIYGRGSRLQSREHMLLSEALATFVTSETGISADYIVAAFNNEKAEFLEINDREEVSAIISTVHRALVTDQLKSFLRPFGGGVPKRMSTNEWEIDDPLPRFALSAMDPDNPFDRDALPTHWILVLRGQIEEAVQGASVTRRAGRARTGKDISISAPPASSPNPASPSEPLVKRKNDPTAEAANTPFACKERLLSKEDVLQLTGFRKSTLYAKIASETFPAQISISPRMSRWRESEVAAWLRNPR